MKTTVVNNIKLIQSDVLFNKWIIDAGRLDHDQYVLGKLAHFLGSGHIVDVGANIGSHAHFYLKKVSPGRDVYCFEPNPCAFECLSHNCPSAIRLPVALGDRVHILPLSLNEANPGASYIGGTSELIVPIMPLDGFYLSDVSFIKIDVEGFEWYTIAGAKETLRQCRPTLWIELSPGYSCRSGKSIDEFLSLIAEVHYVPLFVYGSAEQADVLFVHCDKVSESLSLARSSLEFREFSAWLSIPDSLRLASVAAFFRGEFDAGV